MAFVFEKVPERELDFLKSLELKNCWGNDLLHISSITNWAADRERDAYLVMIGGGYKDMPEYSDLWWEGHTIRLEIWEGGQGNYDTGVDIIWNILRIPIPQEIWDEREVIVEMIKEAFFVYSDWCPPEFLKSITVNIKCKPEII